MASLEDIEALRQDASRSLDEVSDEQSLESWRIAHLGRSGALTVLLRSIGGLPPEDRKLAGRAANELKGFLESSFESKAAAVKRASVEASVTSGRIDVSLPGRPLSVGRLHPITQTQRDIIDAFVAQGFSVSEGRRSSSTSTISKRCAFPRTTRRGS